MWLNITSNFGVPKITYSSSSNRCPKEFFFHFLVLGMTNNPRVPVAGVKIRSAMKEEKTYIHIVVRRRKKKCGFKKKKKTKNARGK